MHDFIQKLPIAENVNVAIRTIFDRKRRSVKFNNRTLICNGSILSYFHYMNIKKNSLLFKNMMKIKKKCFLDNKQKRRISFLF